MSEGTIRQFVDYTSASDDNQNEPESIEPILNGENVIAGVGGIANRPAENLRERSEVIRGVLEDLQYLADADRHLCLGGPGLVTWPGIAPGNTGIPVLSDSLYIVPVLTPGLDSNNPPVASAYGTLQLDSIEVPDGGILCTSMRRSYSGGDQISVEVVAGTVFSVAVAADGRTILVTAIAGTTTLLEVKTAINALVDGEATQFVAATYYGAGADAHVIVAPQTKQFVAGNYDGEAHLITAANLASFFAADAGANVLREGDSLCIWYDYLIDPGTPATKGGRRQAIPENTNTTVIPGAFFNSRVHPERLVNALPVAKVLDGLLFFIGGAPVPAGSTDFNLFVDSATTPWGPGDAWFDGTANPPTTIGAQVSKIVTDLGAAAGTGAAKIGAPAITGTTPLAWPTPVRVDTALADLLGRANANYVIADGNATDLATYKPLVDAHSAQFDDYARSGVVTLDSGSATGLQWNVVGGVYWMNGARVTYAGGSVTLADNQTNYVYMDTDGVLKTTTSVTVAFAPPRLPLVIVTTVGGAVSGAQHIRRFITRQNSKHYVTVRDAGNADFTSLENAVAWVRATQAASTGENKPTIIQLLGDTTVTSQIDIDFPLDLRGSANRTTPVGIQAPAASYALRFMAGSDGSRISGVRFVMSQVASGSGCITTGTSTVEDVVIDGCTFVGGNSAYAITLNSYTYGWRIQNNTFLDMAGTGVFIGGAVAATNIAIQNNRFQMLTFTADHIYATMTRGVISGNTFVGGLRALRLSATDALIQGNSIYAAYDYGIFNAGNRTVISGNYVNAGLDTNGAIRSNGKDCVIENNHIHDWAIGPGIQVGGDQSIVAGNKLYGDPSVESTFGPGIYLDTANECVVRDNYVDLKPGSTVGDGCDGGFGIDGGIDTEDNQYQGNTVLNCGSTSSVGRGIRAGKRSVITGNVVRNSRGYAYDIRGPYQVVTGNRSQTHGNGSNFYFYQNTALENCTESVITGNWASYPGGSYSNYNFDGTGASDNRFWGNYGSTEMGGSRGYVSAKSLYKSYNPPIQTYVQSALVLHATWQPENGYAGIVPQRLVIPAKVTDIESWISFYYSDGTAAQVINTTGAIMTVGRGDFSLGKDGPCIVEARCYSTNTGTTLGADLTPFELEGEYV